MVKEIVIILRWENTKFFEMTQKIDNESRVTTVRVEENSDIAGIWDSVNKICVNSFARHIAIAGDEMKA